MTTQQLTPPTPLIRACAATMTCDALSVLDFELPAALEAGEPPEARGLARDEVRLMVSYQSDNRVVHSTFRNLADFLQAGDVVVINTSGTLNAALHATRADGTPLELHLSTQLPAELWSVEMRQPDGTATKPFYGARPGETLQLPGDVSITLHRPYNRDDEIGAVRLWLATLSLPSGAVYDYLAEHGFPIRYGYVREQWPASYYQTVFANEPGSAEMPSAGRAFTPELLTQLVARGIQVAPLVLHTGVASLETHEPPYEEYYRVPAATAQLVNAARASGRRVIAIGTTVMRALESVSDADGNVHPGEGWTGLVISPAHPPHAADALLTGLHEPRATHLAILQALSSLEHLQVTYTAALEEGYLWHEFGDLHLILP